MKREDIMTNSRFAGAVKRYHTWPTINQQTVADHSWNCMRIYFLIWGPLPPEVSTYLLWHDAGELVTGDLPFPIKANSCTLKQILDAKEGEAVTRMGGQLLALDEQLLLRIKVVDLVEMHQFGRVELAMGNQLARPIVDDTCAAVLKKCGQLSKEDGDLVLQYLGEVLA